MRNSDTLIFVTRTDLLPPALRGDAADAAVHAPHGSPRACGPRDVDGGTPFVQSMRRRHTPDTLPLQDAVRGNPRRPFAERRAAAPEGRIR